MNCERAEQMLVDYLYGELPPEDRKAFEQHLQDCPAHAREVAKLGGVLNLVREQKPEEVPDQLSDRIMHLAKAEMDQQTQAARKPWWKLLYSPVAAAAILAGVVLTVGLAVTQLGPDREKAPATAEATRPVAAPSAGQDYLAAKEQPEAEYRPQEEVAGIRALEEKKEAKADAPKGIEAEGDSMVTRKPRAVAMDKEYQFKAKPKAEPKPKPALKIAVTPKKPRRSKRRQSMARPAKKKREAARRGLGGSWATREAKEKSSGLQGAPGSAATTQPAAPKLQGSGFDDAKAKTDKVVGKVTLSQDGAAAPAEGAAGAKSGDRDEARDFAKPPPPARKRPVAKQVESTSKTAATKPAPAPPAVDAQVGLEDEMPLQEAPELLAEESSAGVARAASRKDSRAKQAEQLDHYQQAEKHLADKEHAKALSAYRKFLAQSPNDRRANTCRFRIAKTLFLMGRCKQAVTATQQAINASARHGMAPSALLDQASCHIRLNQFDKARKVYRKIERDYPAYGDDAQQGLRRIQSR